MLLSEIQGSTDMLVCAEDLGDVPRCVPRVLQGLGILGLRIVRWAREYEKTPPGQQAPFTPPSRYPAALGLHALGARHLDDPRMVGRGPGGAGAVLPFPGRKRNLPAAHDGPAAGEDHWRYCCGARSLLCMFQVQDLLDLDESLWDRDPESDRINVPGTVNGPELDVAHAASPSRSSRSRTALGAADSRA